MVTYVQYVTGTEKGETAADTVLNDPFHLAKVDSNYTSQAVVEAITSTAAAMALAWAPVVEKAFVDTAGTAKDVKIIASDGTVTFADLDSDGKVPAASLVAGGKVAYKYDNVVIPQEKLPTLKARIKEIPLLAHARRIAVYYKHFKAVA